MSVFTGRRGDEYFKAIEEQALELGLALVMLPEAITATGQTYEQISLFVTNIENLWRVKAYTSFLNIMNRYQPWSDGAEHFQSFLLGYSDEKITEWMKYKKSVQLAWGACTIYFSAPVAYSEKLKLLGNRCFHPEYEEGGIMLLFLKKHMVPKAEAFELLPVGTILGRLAISWRSANDVFGNFENMEQSDFATAVLSPQSVPVFNSGIRSAIEILDKNGWS